jgi:hypothetical protein
MMRQQPQVVPLVRGEALDPTGCACRIGAREANVWQRGTHGGSIAAILRQILFIRVARPMPFVHVQVRFVADLKGQQPIADSTANGTRFGYSIAHTSIAQVETPDE